MFNVQICQAEVGVLISGLVKTWWQTVERQHQLDSYLLKMIILLSGVLIQQFCAQQGRKPRTINGRLQGSTLCLSQEAAIFQMTEASFSYSPKKEKGMLCIG